MPKFVFKLEGVLRQREGIEQQRKRELAVVQGQWAALQAELRNLDTDMRSAEQDLRNNRLVGRLDLPFLAAYRRFGLAMQRKALNLAQKIAAIQRQVDEARSRLADAAKSRKVIEKLRERQFLRWREDQNRRERVELDEIGNQLSFTPNNAAGPMAQPGAS